MAAPAMATEIARNDHPFAPRRERSADDGGIPHGARKDEFPQKQDYRGHDDKCHRGEPPPNRTEKFSGVASLDRAPS